MSAVQHFRADDQLLVVAVGCKLAVLKKTVSTTLQYIRRHFESCGV